MTQRHPHVPMQAIVQARVGSTRLPDKIFARIGERTVIDWVIHRLRQSKRIERIVLATGEGEANLRLVDVAMGGNVDIFRGSEEDVLARFAGTIDTFPCEHFCRITGDNPLLDGGFLDSMIEHHLTHEADHTSAGGGGPLGATAEVVSTAALRAAHGKGKEPGHREHVTPFIYTNPQRFRLERLPLPGWMAERPYRLTVDTAEDMALMRELYQRLNGEGKAFNLKSALLLLDTSHDLLAINNAVSQRNWRS